MSDATKDTTPDTSEGRDGSERDMVPTHIHDWFLASLISWANDFNLEQGITLSVGGAVVSGQLISGKRYFEELATLTRSATGSSEEITSGIAEAIRKWTAIYDKPDPLPDDYVPQQPGYIHLRDARWLYPNGNVIPGNHGVLWRGKLSAVDGFCLGQMGPAKP